MNRDTLTELVEEQKARGSVTTEKEVIDFVLQTLGYAWQDGDEASVIALLKKYI